jgi:hypothetical protein
LLLQEIKLVVCLRATGFVSSIEPQRAICHDSYYQDPCHGDQLAKTLGMRGKSNGFRPKDFCEEEVERTRVGV